MFNNEVTYHEKWDTMENNAALKKLDEKFFNRSICVPHCPVGWAPEVLSLLEQLDKEFGIARNTETIRGYYPKGSFVDWFFLKPIGGLKYSFKKFFSKGLKSSGDTFLLSEAIYNVLYSSIEYGIQCVKVLYLNPILNKIIKPKVFLSQVKEKHGYLTIYFCSPKEHEEYIQGLIKETVNKLVAKGAYYSL